MFRRLSWLLCLFLVCFVLCSSALADSGKGLLHTFKEWNEKYNENTEANYDITLSSEPDALLDEDLFYENSGISLMSLTPEDIAYGDVLVVMYSLPQGDTDYKDYYGFVSTGKEFSSTPMNSVKTSNVLNRLNYPADTTKDIHWFDRIEVCIPSSSSSNRPLFSKGSKFDFFISNVICYWDIETIYTSGTKTVTDYFINSRGENYFLQLVLHDKEGNYEKFKLEDYYINPSGDGFNFSGTSPDVPFDVYRITFELVYTINGAFGIPIEYLTFRDFDEEPRHSPRHHIGFVNSVLEIEEVDETTGFLSSIVTAVNNIWTSIVNLPRNIANFLIDGLKSLFVPADGFFDGYVDKWDTFFADHFGFIYTAIDTIVDIFTTIIASMDETEFDTITVPEFTYSFGDTDFTFGGWKIDIVPVIELQFALRVLTNILFTLMFVNMCYKKFQSIVGNKED